MSQTMPLFPLGTVLYPGLLLPLHIFEPRYRQLVNDLQEGPEPRRFGVIAIRKGRETGVDGIEALYEIGCTATLREVTELPDGRYYLVTVGTSRFRLTGLDTATGPYLRAEVELLADEAGDEPDAQVAAAGVRQAFRGYVDLLNERGIAQLGVTELPGEPLALSYLVATAMVIDLSDQQLLLAEPDAASRLRTERSLLSREISMLRSLSSAPAPDLRHSPYNPN
jgi:Lon protease-like protein